MSQTTARAARPTTAADLWRLADRWRRNGVRILTECVSGERFATSATEPGTLYRLTAYSCTCKGYVRTGRCQHHSLLLAELGWLPEVDPEPEPPTPTTPAPAAAPKVACPKVACPEYDGIGCAGFDEDDDGRYWPVERCERCGGEGVFASLLNSLGEPGEGPAGGGGAEWEGRAARSKRRRSPRRIARSPSWVARR